LRLLEAKIFPLGNMACFPLPPIPAQHSEARVLSYPADMTRPDLTLKMTGANGSESIEHRTVEIQGSPRRRRAAPRLSRSSHGAARHRRRPSAAPAKRARALVDILGQAREHHALFRYPRCADDVV
jgi:hypothetical protein